MSEIQHIRASIGELARDLYERSKADAEMMPEWRSVDLAEFPHVDRAFYDEVARYLIAEGFRLFGDYEDVAATRAYPDFRAPLRTFTSGDGAATASAWHIRSQGKQRMQEVLFGRATNVRCVSFASEFADGTFVITSSTKGRDRGIEIPGVLTQRLAPTAPIESLLTLHRRAVAAHPSKPVPAETAEESIESGHRLRHRADHLRRIGYVDIQAESKRWRDHSTPDIAAMLEREIAHLQARDAAVERTADGIE